MELTFNELPQAISILSKKMDILIEMMVSEKGEEIMNIEEAAKFVKLSVSNIEKDKTVPKRYKGSRKFFLKSELLNWMLEEEELETVQLHFSRNSKKAS